MCRGGDRLKLHIVYTHLGAHTQSDILKQAQISQAGVGIYDQ